MTGRASPSITILFLALFACGDIGSNDPVDPGSDPGDDIVDPGMDEEDPTGGVEMGPDCAELVPSPGAAISCFDFNSGEAPGWTPEGGAWSVSDGVYVGTVSSLEGSECGASSMMTSMLETVQARNVRIELDMTSRARADKIVVLRGLDPSNRIELNLRARFSDDSPGDLVVQELTDCVQTLHTERFQVELPHEIDQTLHAVISLVDDAVAVWVDDRMVLMAQFPFADRVGEVGVGAIEGGTVLVDNVIVEVLDPI